LNNASRALLLTEVSTKSVDSANNDFNQCAPLYDQWYQTQRGRIYDHVEKKTVDQLLGKNRPGTKLLDVGCGTGHWSLHFSEKGFHVTGVDLSTAMIQIARQKQIPNSHFDIGDGRNLPFKDESFDVAVAITVLEFTIEPAKIISEMVRCVKKRNGTIVIGVLNALSGYNQKRKKIPGSVYASANLFTPQQIYNLLSGYGKAKLLTTGFVPQEDWLLGMYPLCECVGKTLSSRKGTFIAARIDL